MTRIPTRVHGVLDYAYGAIALVLPSIGGFAHGAAGWIMSVAGAGVLLLAVLTDYELGLVRVIPMRAHIALDCLAGGVLAILPPILHFSPGVSTVYVLAGLFALGAGVLTAPAAADGPPDGMQVRHSSVSGPTSSALPAGASASGFSHPEGGVDGEGEAERSRIDSGRSGERAGIRDPATAPLGTDTEASGAPTISSGAPGGPHAGPS